MAEAKTSRWFWVLALIIFSFLFLTVVAHLTEYLTPVKSGVETFSVSFLIGMGGAAVYLALLLMTEKNLSILENSIVKDMNLMSLLFVMSGGFVAAVTQTTTGTTFSTNSLQSVFMIGFGWQGALTGVAGSSTRVKLNEEIQQVKTSLGEGLAIALQSKDTKIEQLTDALRKVSEEKLGGG